MIVSAHAVAFFVCMDEITEKEALNQGLTIINPNLPGKEPLCCDLEEKVRAAFILYISGFKVRQLYTLLKLSRKTIYNYIRKGYEKYPKAKRV